MAGGVSKTFYIDDAETDHLFWVDETLEQDMAFYEVDYGERQKMMYTGPSGSHKEVIVDAILRLVGRGSLPAEVLDLPLKTLENSF